jgi:type IV pilus assembly protein PilB
VRRLCEHCKILKDVSEAEKRALQLPESVFQLYRAVGCPDCLRTGFRGRIGIHEFMLYNQEIKELVLSVQNAREIEQQAMVSGMLTVYEDGLLKVSQGLTTIEEVLRVTSRIEG